MFKNGTNRSRNFTNLNWLLLFLEFFEKCVIIIYHHKNFGRVLNEDPLKTITILSFRTKAYPSLR